MPSARMIFSALLRSMWFSAVGQRLRRRDHDGVARVDAHRVEVLHVADRDAGADGVSHHLVLDLFPAHAQRLLDKHLRDRRLGREPALRDAARAPRPGRRYRRRCRQGCTRGGSPPAARSPRAPRSPAPTCRRSRALRRRLADRGQQGPGTPGGPRRDGSFHARAEQPHVVLLEDARLGQRDSEVEARYRRRASAAMPPAARAR